jgi:hypothetical protein
MYISSDFLRKFTVIKTEMKKNEKLRKPHHKDATNLHTHKKIKIEKMGN